MAVTFVLMFISVQIAMATPPVKLNIKMEKANLSQVLKAIEKQSGYSFLFNADEIDVAQPVSLVANDLDLDQVLGMLTKGKNISYTIKNNKIVLESGKPASSATHQQKKVTGTVVDSKGNTIPGVNVIIKGKTTGVATDIDGKFTINASKGDVLAISSIGYKAQEIAVKEGEHLSIILEEDTHKIDEVVVVGYGVQKKANLTGAVSSVTSDKLKDRAVTSISTALQGSMPGVTITQGSGQPGADFGQIRIRGIGTINNANPMVLVDGIESSMNDVNPSDIESISVLKDASSASIYGSKAANGVILITTKHGTNKPLQVSYKGYYGWQSPTSLPDYLPSWQSAELYNEARANEGKAPAYTQQDIDLFKAGTDPDFHPNTDWLKLFYKGSGAQQSHYADLAGGTEQTKYMFSLGYFNQEGIIKIANSDRYNFRANFDSKVSSRLTIGANVSFSKTINDEPTNPFTGDMAQIFRQVNRIPNWIPYKYSDGSYGRNQDGNPISWMDLGAKKTTINNNLFSVFSAELELFKGMKLKQIFNYSANFSNSSMFIKDITYYSFTTKKPNLYKGPNSETDYCYNSTKTTNQTLLTYDKSIKEHNFKLLAGYSQELTRYDWTQGYRKSFPSNSIYELNGGAPEGQLATGSAAELANRSFFGRLNYDYAGKYLLEGNVRCDGSSRFTSANRWGVFPSFSAGWRVSEEEFLKNNEYISNLKLRGSWGQLGNEMAVSGTYYPAIATLSTGVNYAFNDATAPGIAIVNSANSNLKWETTETWDAGFDLGMFGNKFSMSGDYFVRNTFDMILQLPVPATFGYGAPYQNAGKVQNKGFELQLGWNDKVGDVNYNLGMNGSYIDNQIKDLKGIDPIISSMFVKMVGKPIDSFYGYQAIGIYASKDAYTQSGVKGVNGNVSGGDLIYKDQNGDKVINGSDRVYLGSSIPKITYGFNAGLSWKGIDFNMFWQGAAKVDGYLWGEAIGWPDGAQKITPMFLDRWTPTNTNASFPRLLATQTQNSPSSNPSSFWVKDASYLRLKSITLGYNIPQKFINILKIKGAKIYYSGQNLLTISSFYKGFDPEAPAGNRGDYYPQTKTNIFGIDINF
jgi:TonB-linked outer membrane protein, SusC/RagA family